MASPPLNPVDGHPCSQIRIARLASVSGAKVRSPTGPPCRGGRWAACPANPSRGTSGAVIAAMASEEVDKSSPQGTSVGSAPRAVISVSDKTGLEEVAEALFAAGYDIVSTGGTAAAIQAAGLPVTSVEQLTGFPEMLDGRVKTLHPAVHGGILARRDNADDMDTIQRLGIQKIDVVIVNLYPFRETVLSEPAPSFQTGVENIDIGGPAMIRAAAKNLAHVAVLVDPKDYRHFIDVLSREPKGEEMANLKKQLAWKAFQHCAAYDAQVSEWLWSQVGDGLSPPALVVPMQRGASLRYGENPHQSAAFYMDQSLGKSGKGGLATAVLHHGKEMSYNNYLDAEAAYAAVCDFPNEACVIVKHTNPCGVGRCGLVLLVSCGH
eukprot:evm.model.scf_287.9 EVM.evm.TU.scf_287.9   scf_287:72666-76116(-)